MANLATLLDKEAGAEIEAILSEARQRASEIHAKAEDDAKAIMAQRQRSLTSQAEAASVRVKSAAQLEAASLRLKAQQQAIETAFAKAEEEIYALIQNRDRYASVLQALLSELLGSLDSATISEVRAHPDDIELLSGLLEEQGISADLIADTQIVGGVKVSSSQTHMSVQNSLLERVQSSREELASEVARILLREPG